MAKKKTTTRPRRGGAQRKNEADAEVVAEKASQEASPAAPEAKSRARGKKTESGRRPPRSRKKVAAQAEPAAATDAPTAATQAPSSTDGPTIQRETDAVVIRLPSVKKGAASTGSTAAPAARAPEPHAPVRQEEREPVAPPAPIAERRPEPRAPEAAPLFDEEEEDRFERDQRDDFEPVEPVEPPPASEIAKPPAPDGADAANEEERGGRRRRRRRRRGRRGGEGEDSERQAGPRPQRPPAPAREAAGRHAPPGEAPGRHAPPGEPDERQLSPSQKRRLRRRRRAQLNREGGVGAGEAGLENDESAAALSPTAAEPDETIAEDVELGEEHAEAMSEARELFEGAEIIEVGPTPASEEPAASALDEVAPTEEDRRGRRRRFRPRRGRREYATDEADSRVYGVEVEEQAIEVTPDEEPLIGADGAVEGAAAPAEAGPRKRKEMIINIARGEECRIAILEDGKLEQIYLERASAESHVGNIYKGVITNVEPSIQAAFIDFGLGKNGFLHISDLHPKYFPNGDRSTENVGRKMPRRNRPPIQRCLRRGQEILVQITKEGIGTKGPTLTTYLSVPGRFLVMMPGMRQLGVSRKIEDEELRRKLRAQLQELELPDDIGFIARTAAEDRSKRELQSDLNYLTRLWRAVEKRITGERAPAELYRDSDLVIRTIRDVFSTDVDRVLVDDREVADRAAEFLSIFSPKARDTVVHYDSPEPIFHKYGIEAELERLHSRHVPLKSGGSLVIDQTEALVAIDVNSGRFRAEDDAEVTAFKINHEAADEIPRQLRLRDLGGVIICDFIDMRMESRRREIEKKLIKNLKQHKERAKVLRMSQFGIIEMTRQRQRASLTRSVYQDCHHCRGTGLVKTAESVTLDVMRLLQLAMTREHIRSIEATVSSDVAYILQNRKRATLADIEAKNHRSISIRPDTSYGLDQVQIQCYDNRGRLAPHP